MRIIRISRGLKLAAAAVFLTVPIAAVQAVVFARAPWWALPVRSIETSTAWAAGASLILAAVLFRGKKIGYWALVAAGLAWVTVGTIAAIRTRNPGLGFLIIFTGVFFGLLTSRVRYELGRSFFDPDMSWFEGSPRSIPALTCDLIMTGDKGDKKIHMKVSRLDEEGAFIFGKKLPKTHQKAELVFRFREREIHCTGLPMIAFKRSGEGMGFLFDRASPDQKKDLGDFIETLRGEGYV